MVHGKNRIPYRIDRRLTGLAGSEYDAIISFEPPFESEDSQYGEYLLRFLAVLGMTAGYPGCARNPFHRHKGWLQRES